MKKKFILIIGLIIVMCVYYMYSIRQRAILQDKIDFYQSIMDSEVEWIKGLQLSNGSFLITPKENGLVKINPYFADYTAMALLKAEVGNDYVEVVRNYLDWHFDHLNNSETDLNGIDGTIYDYEVELVNGTVVVETSTGKYDSVDSYAASFLDLLWEFYVVTDDEAYMIEHYDKILRIISALNAMIEEDLAIAKPDYPVKYLMDNSEVYEGLVCATKLFDKVYLQERMKNTIEYKEAELIYRELIDMKNKLFEEMEAKLWNKENKNYSVGIQKGDKQITDFDWNEFYPDATSQLFPIIHGVLDNRSSRAKYLYKVFNKHYEWEKFEHYTDGHDDFYWGRLVYVASVMEDEDRVNEYMNYYIENVIPEHKKPLYNADAAWVIMSSEKMIELYKERMKWLLPEL